MAMSTSMGPYAAAHDSTWELPRTSLCSSKSKEASSGSLGLGGGWEHCLTSGPSLAMIGLRPRADVLPSVAPKPYPLYNEGKMIPLNSLAFMVLTDPEML